MRRFFSDVRFMMMCLLHNPIMVLGITCYTCRRKHSASKNSDFCKIR